MIITSMVRKIKVLYRMRDHINYARSLGVKVGDDCNFVDNPNWGSEPYLITVGNHVLISGGVTFANHDGATWVLRKNDKYRDTFKFGRIRIGDNCFIGHGSILLPNVSIGENSIVAAGSIVTKSIPAGEVWGGIPAHFIMKTEEYAERCYENRPPIIRDNLIQNKRKELLRVYPDR